eukprot:m.27621 g.27621  ORF g.27621 m.27621 type:complete len:52 (-) comp10285_c0_seq1:85-240(-)
MYESLYSFNVFFLVIFLSGSVLVGNWGVCVLLRFCLFSFFLFFLKPACLAC